jgi:hypothetical protein
MLQRQAISAMNKPQSIALRYSCCSLPRRAHLYVLAADDCRAPLQQLQRHRSGPDITDQHDHDNGAGRHSTVAYGCVARIAQFEGGASGVGRLRGVSVELFATMAGHFPIGWAFRGTDDIAGQRTRHRLAMH